MVRRLIYTGAVMVTAMLGLATIPTQDARLVSADGETPRAALSAVSELPASHSDDGRSEAAAVSPGCRYPDDCERPPSPAPCDVAVFRSEQQTGPDEEGRVTLLHATTVRLVECDGPGAYLVAAGETSRDGNVTSFSLGSSDRRDELLFSGIVVCAPAQGGGFTATSVTRTSVSITAIGRADGTTHELTPAQTLLSGPTDENCSNLGPLPATFPDCRLEVADNDFTIIEGPTEASVGDVITLFDTPIFAAVDCYDSSSALGRGDTAIVGSIGGSTPFVTFDDSINELGGGVPMRGTCTAQSDGTWQLSDPGTIEVELTGVVDATGVFHATPVSRTWGLTQAECDALGTFTVA